VCFAVDVSYKEVNDDTKQNQVAISSYPVALIVHELHYYDILQLIASWRHK
jgi:hypothetical protein